MNNILAAKVLMSHLPEITDGAYKTATEIAIETLFKDAIKDYLALPVKTYMKPWEYLELTEDEYFYWLLGGEKVAETKILRGKNV